MKNAKVAAMLMACTEASSLRSLKTEDLDDKDSKLSQSFASAFQMEAPKLMTTTPLPNAGKGACPGPGQKLTSEATGGAFIDGCYMNTTRTQERNETTGEEAQAYLYMWKHACAYTKWVPSNQFMYSNLDYDENTMTLERFGFIGMDRKCFWGSIGVLWKRPLPVNQILPESTVLTQKAPPPPPKPSAPSTPPAPTPPKPPVSLVEQEGQLQNRKSKDVDNTCLGVGGNKAGAAIMLKDCQSNGSDVWQLMKTKEWKHKKTGLCVGATGKGNGAPMSLQACDGGKDQKWGVVDITKVYFQLKNQDNSQCVDIPWYGGEKGLKAQLWQCRTENFTADNMEYKWKK